MHPPTTDVGASRRRRAPVDYAGVPRSIRPIRPIRRNGPRGQPWDAGGAASNRTDPADPTDQSDPTRHPREGEYHAIGDRFLARSCKGFSDSIDFLRAFLEIIASSLLTRDISDVICYHEGSR